MTEPVVIGNATLYLGDCLDVLRTLPNASVDSVVTDPPAGIGFMGKEWDHHKGGRAQWVAWMTDVAAECLRVLKPGGHALVWSIPRTSHWTATAWEDAGFEPRDRIAHCFGSGFPKSLNISVAIDKAAGAEREVVGSKIGMPGVSKDGKNQSRESWRKLEGRTDRQPPTLDITAPATEAARQWSGWGTALKPAIEDWWLMRKPLDGTVAANVLKHGVGGLNIDGCRVGEIPPAPRNAPKKVIRGGKFHASAEAEKEMSHYNPTLGRFPANLIHDGSDEVVGLFPVTTSPSGESYRRASSNRAMSGANTERGVSSNGHGDTGSAARFFKTCPIEDDDIEAARLFYCAKASRKERNAGLEGMPEREGGAYGAETVEGAAALGRKPRHQAGQMKLRDDLTPEQRGWVLSQLEAAGVSL